MKQLDGLALEGGVLDEAGAELILKRRDAIAHIPHLSMRAPTTRLTLAFDEAFDARFEAWVEQEEREAERVD